MPEDGVAGAPFHPRCATPSARIAPVSEGPGQLGAAQAGSRHGRPLGPTRTGPADPASSPSRIGFQPPSTKFRAADLGPIRAADGPVLGRRLGPDSPLVNGL